MVYVLFFIMIQSVHLWMAKNFPNQEFREAAFLFPGNELFLENQSPRKGSRFSGTGIEIVLF